MIGPTIDFGDSIGMTNDFIIPTLTIKNKELADELLAELRSGADSTIKIFYISIPVGILVVFIILRLTYTNLSKKRNLMAKTLIILPADFIFLNRSLR